MKQEHLFEMEKMLLTILQEIINTEREYGPRAGPLERLKGKIVKMLLDLREQESLESPELPLELKNSENP